VLEYCVSVTDSTNADLIIDEIVPALRAIGPRNPGADTFHAWYTRRGRRIAWSPVTIRSGALAGILTTNPNQFVSSIRSLVQKHPNLRSLVVPAIRELLLRASPTADGDEALVLKVAADDRDGLMRQAAVRALAVRIDDPAVRTVLEDRARRDEVIAVRQAAIQVLGQRAGEAEIREVIMNEVRNDNHPHVRQAAVAVLGQWIDEPVIRASIEDWARNQNHAEVRLTAIVALGQRIDSKDVRVLLLSKVRFEKNPNVRQAAVRACGQMVDDREMRKRLLVWADDAKHAGVRESSIRALGRRLDQSDVRSKVEERARRDENWHVRQAAVQALAPLAQEGRHPRAPGRARRAGRPRVRAPGGAGHPEPRHR